VENGTITDAVGVNHSLKEGDAIASGNSPQTNSVAKDMEKTLN